MTEKYILLYRKNNAELWEKYAFSDLVIVGSSAKSDLVIPDGDLSDVHFELRENPTGIFLKDVDPETGETLYKGTPLPAGRPAAVDVTEVFRAGDYEFQVTLNIEEVPERVTGQQLFAAIQKFGIWKAALIALGVVGVAVIGGWLIFSKLIQRPDDGGNVPIADTQQTPEISEMIVPTNPFELSNTAVVEAIDAMAAAPGLGNFELQEFIVDASSMDISDLMQFAMNPDQLLNMAATISGENIGYLYKYSGIRQNGRIIAVMMEFIEAEEIEMVDGVQVPDWAEGEIPVELFWDPAIRFIEDGQQRAIALFEPTIYGAEAGEQVYHVQGIYQSKNSTDQLAAIARFGEDGKLIDLLTFGKIEQERPTPYKVNYQPGDTFTPYELEFIHDPQATQDMAIGLMGGSLPFGWSQLLQLAIGQAEDGSFQFGIGNFERKPGTSLVIQEEGLSWTFDELPEGDFMTGIAVEDLDGNFFVGYIPVIVKP